MAHTDDAQMTQSAHGPNAQVVGAFLRRLEALEFDELGVAIRIWREELSDGWHEADQAVATAIRDTNRHHQQEMVLEALYDVFRRAPWFSAEQPGARIAASDATAQYVATTALMALLVRDRLAPEHLEVLYRPFSSLIPLAELDGQSAAASRAAPTHDSARDDRPGAA